MQARARILVAEDDRSVRDLIRAYLQLAGHDVLLARDGAEALSMARTMNPDAMVLDINMPELDGFMVLFTLFDGAAQPFPVLVLTARHHSEDVRKAIRLGAKDFLAKPFSENQLVTRVTRLLRSGGAPGAVSAA